MTGLVLPFPGTTLHRATPASAGMGDSIALLKASNALLDLAIAFMSRTLPQMNVLLLGFQVKSMATLVMLPIALAVSGGLFLRLLRTALQGMPGLLGQGGG